ncbi:MAG: hypothetical protein VW338_16570 [Rhodospirillaceae bacterium]
MPQPPPPDLARALRAAADRAVPTGALRHFDRAEAEAVATQIETFWRRLGFAIEVRIAVDEDAAGRRTAWCVRSNLVDGLPPDAVVA